MGGRGSVSTSYQGVGSASGKATSTGLNAFTARDRIEKEIEKYPKIAEGSDEALRQLRSLKSENDMVTIYRAAPAGHINTGDWVFLDRGSAERWSKSPFTRKTKVGKNGREFRVLEAKVPASSVDFTGKNLEFQYTGKRRKSK